MPNNNKVLQIRLPARLLAEWNQTCPRTRGSTMLRRFMRKVLESKDVMYILSGEYELTIKPRKF